MNTPPLRDPSGRYTIGPEFDGECSAPEVTLHGVLGERVVGVYIDDETPHQLSWVEKAAAKYGPHGLVIASVSMSTPQLRYRIPGVVTAQEWYPFHSGYSASDWGPMPNANAYIVQWAFWGFQGTHPPNFFQRRLLLRQVRKRKPRLILYY